MKRAPLMFPGPALCSRLACTCFPCPVRKLGGEVLIFKNGAHCPPRFWVSCWVDKNRPHKLGKILSKQLFKYFQRYRQVPEGSCARGILPRSLWPEIIVKTSRYRVGATLHLDGNCSSAPAAGRIAVKMCRCAVRTAGHLLHTSRCSPRRLAQLCRGGTG